VHGCFSTWIGSPARNRAWDLLVEAKRAADTALREAGTDDALRIAEIERQLAVCEASDWFWWLDERNPHPDVADFDALYRAQLAVLYRLCGQPPPERLRQSLVGQKPEDTMDAASAEAGAMRRSGAGE
jgi:alpha-amylase/alpha-mannosidase (GH57 family)